MESHGAVLSPFPILDSQTVRRVERRSPSPKKDAIAGVNKGTMNPPSFDLFQNSTPGRHPATDFYHSGLEGAFSNVSDTTAGPNKRILVW
jgi:hypothetical protein